MNEAFPQYRQLWLPEVDSTNLECCRRWEAEQCRWLVAADRQTGGRGRYGRAWDSAGGVNVYLSFIFDNPFGTAVGHVNLFFGVLLWETLISLYGGQLQRLTVKWPNDLYLGEKKLAGILMHNVDERFRRLVVGMGVNVYAQGADIPSTAVSLSQELGESLGREARVAIVRELLSSLHRDRAKEYEDPEVLLERFWECARFTRERPYRYHLGNSEVEGKLRRVYPDGTIEISTARGDIHLIT